MKKRRLIFIFAASLAVIGSTASVTYAYLTGQDRAENLIGTTENEIHIEEEFEPPTDPGPGTLIKKAPRIVNDSEVGVYVRVAVYFSDSAAEYFCEPLAVNGDWRLAADGYYYYDAVLAPGGTTGTIFDRIVIREDVEAEELVPFDLLVYAESVQSFGMTQEEAWAYYGGGAG